MNREEVFVLQTFFIRRYFVVNGCSCFQQEREKNFSKKFSKTPPKNHFLFQTSERTFNFLFKIPPFFRFSVQTSEGYIKIFSKSGDFGCAFRHPLSKCVKGVFTMARLSKKLKQEWALFINPKTGRRTYNDLCRKCRKDCKQSFRAIVVSCPLYCSKRSVKSPPNSNDFDDSG